MATERTRRGDASVDDVLAALRSAAERDGVEDVDAVVAQFATFVRAQAPHLASAPHRRAAGRSGGGTRTLALLGSAAVIAALAAGVGTGAIANPLRTTTSADASDGASDDDPLLLGVTPDGGTAGSGATGAPASEGAGALGAVDPPGAQPSGQPGGETQPDTLIEVGAGDVVDAPVAAMTFSDPDAVALELGSAGPTGTPPVPPVAPAGPTDANAPTGTTPTGTAPTTTTAPDPSTTVPLQESPADPLAEAPPAPTAPDAPDAPDAPADDDTGGDPA